MCPLPGGSWVVGFLWKLSWQKVAAETRSEVGWRPHEGGVNTDSELGIVVIRNRNTTRTEVGWRPHEGSVNTDSELGIVVI